MTNSNDFRRYSYMADLETSRAVEAFSLSRSSAAPIYVPQPREQRKPFSVNTNRRLKSKNQLVAEQRLARRKVAAILVSLALAASMLFGMLYTYALKNEYAREISNLKTEISREENQCISTKARLESLVNIEQIEEYAVNELGMVKTQPEQIEYIDVEQYKGKRLVSLREEPPAALAEQVGK